MRIKREEYKVVRGIEARLMDVKEGLDFIDPWGVVWRAVGDPSTENAANGHAAVGAFQLTVNDKNRVVTTGQPMTVEVPVDRPIKIIEHPGGLADLEKLFYFDPNEK